MPHQPDWTGRLLHGHTGSALIHGGHVNSDAVLSTRQQVGRQAGALDMRCCLHAAASNLHVWAVACGHACSGCQWHAHM